MTNRIFFTTFSVLIFVSQARAQNPDADLQTAQRSQETKEQPTSELVLNVGFDSRALVAGRDFNVQQNAILPGLSYYHASGINAGIRGSLLSNTDPKYSQTTLQVGYGRALGDHFFTSVNYERYIFNPADEGLIQNAVSLFAHYTFGKFSVGTSYTALFDPEKAHQLNVSCSGYFAKNDLKHCSSLSFSPAVSLLAGTESVTLQRFGNGTVLQGTGRRWEDRITKLPPRPNQPIPATADTFAPLSLNLGLPISIQMGKLQFSAAFQYIIPFATENETDDGTLSNTAFVSLGLSYTLFSH